MGSTIERCVCMQSDPKFRRTLAEPLVFLLTLPNLRLTQLCDCMQITQLLCETHDATAETALERYRHIACGNDGANVH
jgi:hypothetical protein